MNPDTMNTATMPIEPVLLSVTPILTYHGSAPLTNATGFFFERKDRLYLVTSQHVFFDDENDHHPDRIVIKFHVDPGNATRTTDFSIPLYHDALSAWVAGTDTAGKIDVAVIEVDRSALPTDVAFFAFTPDNLLERDENIEIATPMMIVGFPLGFHDTLHKLPVVRHAINASSFSMRFQGNGYFLTDARTHRGSSGAPVVCRHRGQGRESFPWILLGVHSSRLDVLGRDAEADEALGLNCAWFADILIALTEQI
jgi:hypothetical protein